MPSVWLRKGHVQPVWAGHPWVFSQAVDHIEGAPAAGDVVTLMDPTGKALGRGFWSPKSAIVVRVMSRDPSDALDAKSFRTKLERAYAWRQEILHLPNDETTGYRLCHAEGDGLPGLVVDVHGSAAIVQLSTLGLKLREEMIFGEVARVTGATTVIEAASRAQKLEGFEVETRVVRGVSPAQTEFRELGLDFSVPVELTQKTGYYFDQRDNRARVGAMAQGRRVLDAFCYLGSFGLSAARGGAESVLCLDSSAPAIAGAAALARKNGLSDRIRHQCEDTRKALPELARRKERFDLVVLDPPKLAPSGRHLKAGKRAYRRVNANALQLLDPGGLLVTCSCSGVMRTEDWLRTLALAARDAERELTVLGVYGAGEDHPVPAPFPEGRYLKCAIVRVQA
ncbi:MAG: class I SAM-dependent rRNA methyltransferase [Deltaproteobacteria bacterium]|nr:class I SAM-dependent rRNA methyltransferase [Deltaproteobacteria bacterium]